MTRSPGDEHARVFVTDVHWLEDRAAGTVNACQAGVEQTMAQVRRWHPRLSGASPAQLRTLSIEDGRLVQAREHGFDTWQAFADYLGALTRGERREPFLDVFEAMRHGRVDEARQQLASHPELLRAWGTNRTTLLNLAVSLAGAGHDRLPEDAWALLDHIIQGSDVTLGNHRGWTPLHQASTPAMIDRLIAAGADVRAEAHGSGGTPLASNLFWGNRASAEALAARAIVPNNLRIAAALGSADLVDACFMPNGELTPEAHAGRGFYRPHVGFPIWQPSDSRQEVLDEALTYAARNGRVSVLDTLVARGANVNGDPYRGTPLAWAAWANQVDTVRWLLAHGAEVNRQGTFGGPGHGNAITALHLAAQQNHVDTARVLLDAGADPRIEENNYHSSPAGWAAHFKSQAVTDLIASHDGHR